MSVHFGALNIHVHFIPCYTKFRTVLLHTCCVLKTLIKEKPMYLDLRIVLF